MTPQELYYRTLDFLKLRSRAYRLTFQNSGSNDVLKDLARFCRAGKTPFQADDRRTYVAIGRQEVFQRILDHLHLSPDELYKIYNTPTSFQQPTKE